MHESTARVSTQQQSGMRDPQQVTLSMTDQDVLAFALDEWPRASKLGRANCQAEIAEILATAYTKNDLPVPDSEGMLTPGLLESLRAECGVI